MSKLSEIIALAKAQLGNNYTTYCKDMGYPYRIEWCACFVSWLAKKVGITDIIPIDMSCNSQIKKFKNLGVYKGTSGAPVVGSIIYYNWDNVYDADHVGIVIAVNGDTVTVIEGNNGNQPNDRVRTRTIRYTSSLIFGWANPNYAKYDGNDPVKEETKPTGSFESQKGPNPQLIFSGKYDDQVKELQVMLNRADNAGLVVDGIFGVKTYTAVKKYTVELFDMGPLIGLVQRRLNKLGFDAGEADGYAEQPTMDGIARFQKAYGLGVGYLGGSDHYYLWR